MSTPSGRKLALKLALSVLFVAFLVWFVPWATLHSALSKLSFGFFALTVALFLGCHSFGVLKWRMVVARAGAVLPLRRAYECYFAGLFANVFLPSIVGGDVFRALLAGKRSGRMEAAVLGGAADRLLDISALAVLALVGAFGIGLGRSGGEGRIIATLAALAAVIGLSALPLLLRVPLRKWPRKVRRPLARSLVALRRQWRSPLVAITSFCGALLIQGSLALLNSWIGARVGIEAPLSAWLFAWSLAKVAGLAPIGFNGIGPRDWVFKILFPPLMTNVALATADRAALALAASLLWQSVLLAGSLSAGALWSVLKRGAPPLLSESKVAHA